MKCQIRWVNPTTGEYTPDDNEAIALAQCFDPVSFGENGSEPIPICEAHAQYAVKNAKFWKLLPLEGQFMDQAHELVQRHHREFRIVPDVVSTAIKGSFKDWLNILQEITWSNLNGCWYFHRYGMYVGVENDGYIHT